MSDPKPARILIVDDEARQTKALCETLRDYGFDVVGHYSSRDAVAELQDQTFDLVLTDLMMPEMDGIALLRAALEVDPSLAVVVMTGQGTIATAVEAMKAGAADYVLKPFKVSVALPVISRSLEVRRLRLENADLHRLERERCEQLEAKNRELASFSAAVSHDLRSPLAAIQGSAWILEKGCGHLLDERGLEVLERLQNIARRMGTLIEDLLKLAQATEAETRLACVDLTKIALSIAKDLQLKDPDRQVQVEIEPGLDALADERLIAIALDNLMANAWKFTSKQGNGRIWVGRDAKDPAGAFFVRDNGAGFAPELGVRLFQPFQRLHSEQEFAGTGIGLATVRRIVERHEGSVWARGEVGIGATFYFTLPGA